EIFTQVASGGARRRFLRRTPRRGSRTSASHVLPIKLGPGARASAAAAVRAASDLPRLDQLEPDVVGRPHECDPRSVRDLDRPLQQAGAEAFEPLDVGLEVRRVEAEVLDPVVSARVARAEALAGAGARDVHRDAAVLALAADEPV